jgi:hypothetical protein
VSDHGSHSARTLQRIRAPFSLRCVHSMWHSLLWQVTALLGHHRAFYTALQSSAPKLDASKWGFARHEDGLVGIEWLLERTPSGSDDAKWLMCAPHGSHPMGPHSHTSMGPHHHVRCPRITPHP